MRATPANGFVTWAWETIMKNKQDDLGYWAGWFAAFGIAALFFIYAVWQGPSLKQSACKPEELDCFRQWVTALGGWAALIVAVPTLLYLAKQIKAADKHHRITTSLDLYRKRALASHIARASTAGLLSIGIEESKTPIELRDMRTIETNLDHYERVLFQGSFDEFEKEVQVSNWSINILKTNMELFRTGIKDVGQGPARAVFNVMYTEVIQTLKVYLFEAKHNAETYLDRTAHFAADLVNDPHD
jgi:hypothetical protein